MVSPDAQDPLPSFRDPLQRIALIVTALAGSAVAAPPVAAQEAWTGGVEVSTSSLTVVEGGSVTYSLRLTEPPTADGWWIMVHVDGSRRHAGEYGGIRWVPSLGWEFNQDNWNQWRDIHIQALDDNVLEGDRSLTFTHEVWDHNADCPVKGASPVTVRVTDNDHGGGPSLRIADASASEGETAEFAVTLSPSSGQTVTVDFETEGGTAQADSDYRARSGSLTFPAGTTTRWIAVPTVEDEAPESTEGFAVTLRNASGATLGDATGQGTILDDDHDGGGGGLPTVDIGDASASEGETAEFTVTLSPSSGQTVTVDFATEGGTAQSGSDFTAQSGSLTFPAGTTTWQIAVPTVEDTAPESTERFTVTLGNPDGATLGDASGQGTILDDDDDGGGGRRRPPTLRIGDASVSEGETAEFTVTLSPSSGQAVTVDFETEGGTAQAGSDYTAQSGSLTFPAGTTTQRIAVPTVEDEAPESTERFTVTLRNASGATLGDASGQGTILDDDDGGGGGGPPTLGIGDASVSEGETAEFTVTLSPSSGQTVTVDFETEGGTAQAGSDYTAQSGSLTFPAGTTTLRIAVPTVEDEAPESTERFAVTLRNANGATLGDVSGQGTILDDDDDGGGGGFPTIGIGDASASEGEKAEFTVTLSRASERTVTVDFATASGTAEAGSDFRGGTGTVTFPAGQTRRRIAVSTVDDDIEEPDERFTVTLRNPDGATLGDDLGEGTIRDDDDGSGPRSLPTLSIADAGTVTEGEKAEFQVTLSRASGRTVTVDFATAAGTAEADADFRGGTGTVTFAAGETTRRIAVSTVDDDVEEPDERFTVTLRNPDGATLGDDLGEGTIRDDDDGSGPRSLPTLSIADAGTVTEGEKAEFQVTLSRASGRTVTVDFATAAGTAEADADFRGGTGTVTFAAGETTRRIAVSTVDDDVEEPDERFTVTLRNPDGATLDDPAGEATIRDDDDGSGPRSLPTLSIADAGTVTEGEKAEFQVTLSRASGRTVTVDFATAAGTAEADADFRGGTGTVTFAAGETTRWIAVSTVDDDVEEPDERFTVTLRNPDGATLDDPAGEATIRDDDGSGPRSLPTLSIADAGTVTEGEKAEFQVTLSRASGRTVTVDFATAAGTAEADADFRGGTGTVTFAAGETTRRIAVSTVDDDVEEPDERFTVTLRNPDGATLDDPAGEATIRDDDGGSGPRSLPGLSIADAGTVTEGEKAEFQVTLSRASGRTVTVAYRTLDGTAVAGSDYRSTAGTLRFAPGETRQTISVPVLDDATAEADERFTVELSAPSGATVADGTAAATIADDDELPVLAVGDAPPVYEGETAEFVVRLSAASGGAVTVAYRTADGTARAGSDYRSAAGTLRFAPGETRRTIAVAVLDDETSEPRETFAAELSAPSGATLADGTGAATILDDDEPPELVIDDAPPLAEGGAAEFVVRLSAASGGAVTVAYRTVDGTATAGSDYTAASGTLRFAPGETSRTVSVAVLADERVEGDEQFTAELSQPSGATIADGTGVGTITDDGDERIEIVNRTVLPEIGRALAFTAVRCRIGRALSDAPRGGTDRPGARLSLSPAWTSGGQGAAGAGALTPEQVLGHSSFLMQSGGDEGDAGRFAAWGCGDYRNLGGGGRDGAVGWDGEVFSAHVGSDVRLGASALAGVSVSRSKAWFDYYAGAPGAETGGAYELRLTGIHPYVAWSVSPGLDVWGTVGHAWGTVRVTDARREGPAHGIATLDSGAVGVSGRLLARGATTLRVKGEGALARMEVAGAGVGFEGAGADLRRVRLGAEVRHDYVFASGASLTPWGELGGRHDGGDGETGAGLEVGGGLRYRNPGAGWTAEGQARWMAAHEGALREWGLAAQVRYAPRASGRGPSLRVMPAWGEAASGVERLWEQGAAGPTPSGVPGARLEAQLGYGFAALRGRGVMTPFGAVRLAPGEGSAYRLGWRWAASPSAAVSLEAERRERSGARVVHALLVRGTLGL